jgi:hypothetical protein
MFREKTIFPLWIFRSIVGGSAFFVFALTVSAVFAPEFRLLHSFQALIYIIVVLLARRKNPFGYGAGFFIAAFWDYIFLQGAWPKVWQLIKGAVFTPDIALQFAGAIANLFIIIAGIAGVKRLSPRPVEGIFYRRGSSDHLFHIDRFYNATPVFPHN